MCQNTVICFTKVILQYKIKKEIFKKYFSERSVLERIIRFLYKNGLFSNLLLVFIVFAAILSITSMKRQSMKNVDMLQVIVTTVYEGASPEDVELNITCKIENAIKEIDGIEKYISKSVENVSRIIISIDQDNDDPEKVKDHINRAIGNISDFPDDLKNDPDIFEVVMENVPVVDIGLTYDKEDMGLLKENADKLKKKLLDLPGVAKVSDMGIREKEFKILLNHKKMREQYISFEEVISAVKKNNLRASGGSVESYTQEKGIVTFSEFRDPGEIENIIIRTGEFSGTDIRIKDIGRVIEGFEERTEIYRFSGKPGVALRLAKKSSKDVIDVVEGQVKPLLDKFQKKYAPEGMDIIILRDDSSETSARLKMVITNAVIGFFLVLLVLFMFLNRKTAFWTSVGIPVSIGISFIFLSFTDVTVNAISLCGFIVVLGMVVDDAIIIAESITRTKEKGETGIDAAVKGVKVVIVPVVGTVLTTAITFCIMYFIPGMEGQFSIEIPTIVILMLAASLLEASILLPVHLAHSNEKRYSLVKPKSDTFFGKVISRTIFLLMKLLVFPVTLIKKMVSVFPVVNCNAPFANVFIKLEIFYEKVLRKVLLHKYRSLLFIMIIWLLALGFGLKFSHFQLFPTDQSSKLEIFAKTSGESSLNYTSSVAAEVEKIIRDIPGESLKSYVTSIGRSENQGDAENGSNVFQIEINLIPYTERDETAEDVKNYIVSKLSSVEGLSEYYFIISGGGPPTSRPVEIEIIGNDNEKRSKISREVEAYLKKFGVVEMESTDIKGKEELRLIPNYSAVARAQLSASSIANVIRTAIDGTIVSYHTTPEDRIPFRVMLDSKSKSFADPLEGLSVRNSLGRLVQIKDLVRIEKTRSAQNIYHYNGDRTTTLRGALQEGVKPVEIYSKLREQYSDFESKYPDFKMVIGGEAERSNDVMIKLIGITLLAFIAIYFILIIQFKSFLQPGIVISAVPFGLSGIFAAFAAHRMDISLMATIGILGFIGVVVNDSLVMVDFINNRLNENKDADNKEKISLIAEGAKYRLRPILLTTITTCAGLFPTAYGLFGGTDILISGMVFAMFWGLVTGTLSALFIVPVIYIILDEFVKYFKSFIKIID